MTPHPTPVVELDRVVQDPRRSDETLRVGLNSVVLARRSSNLGNVAGPFTKSTMWRACSALRPGSTSTSTTLRTRSGAISVRAIVVRPPYDIPTTPRASGARALMATATSPAAPSVSGRSVAAPRARPNDRDREGRSRSATSGAGPWQPCPRCERSANHRAAAPTRACHHPRSAHSTSGLARPRRPRVAPPAVRRTAGRTPWRSRGTTRTRRTPPAPRSSVRRPDRRSPRTPGALLDVAFGERPVYRAHDVYVDGHRPSSPSNLANPLRRPESCAIRARSERLRRC